MGELLGPFRICEYDVELERDALRHFFSSEVDRRGLSMTMHGDADIHIHIHDDRSRSGVVGTKASACKPHIHCSGSNVLGSLPQMRKHKVRR